MNSEQKRQLEGLRVWLTRPRQQVDALQKALRDAGAEVSHFPMLEIKPLAIDAGIRAAVMNLDNYDGVIFISTNAASLGMACIEDFWPQYPAHLFFYALGPSTAKVIEGFGVPALYPRAGMSSEALLAMPELAHLSGKKLLIFRGVGGRELLAETLRERGASVDYVELYQRQPPDYPPGAIARALKQERPSAIVVSSAEAMDSLLGQLAEDEIDLLLGRPLLLSSPRLDEIARSKGFRKRIVMPGANDDAVLKTLVNEKAHLLALSGEVS